MKQSIKQPNYRLPLNLQFFAEDPDPSSGGGGNPDDKDKQQVKTYTQEEFQRELDRRTNQFVEDKKKIEGQFTDLSGQFEELKKNAMTDKQRADYEKQQQEQKAQDLEKQLADREKQLQDRENRLIVRDKLDDAKIPQKFADFVLADTEEEISKRVTSLKSHIDELVAEEVQKKFKDHSTNPAGGGGAGSADKNPWSPEHFDLTAQGQLFREDAGKARQMASQHGYTL